MAPMIDYGSFNSIDSEDALLFVGCSFYAGDLTVSTTNGQNTGTQILN